MDNQRLLVWAFFGLIAWITYQTWMQDYGPKPAPPAAQHTTQESPAPTTQGIDDDLPEITAPTTAGALPAAPGEQQATTATATAPTVRVTTDVLDVEIRKIPFAYPIYDLCYRDHLQPVMDYVGQLQNLQTTGRQGNYRYNNMDHSMAMGRSTSSWATLA